MTRRSGAERAGAPSSPNSATSRCSCSIRTRTAGSNGPAPTGSRSARPHPPSRIRTSPEPAHARCTTTASARSKICSRGPSNSETLGSLIPRERPDSQVPPLDDERTAGGDARIGVDGQAQLALAEAVDLQADESPGVSLVYLLVRQILNLPAIHPGLDARPSGDDAQRIPAVVHEVWVPFGDFGWGREPVCSHSFSVQQPGCWLSLVEASDFNLRPVHPSGRNLEASARSLHRPDLRSDLDSGVRDSIDRGFELQLEVVELEERAQEGVHA